MTEPEPVPEETDVIETEDVFEELTPVEETVIETEDESAEILDSPESDFSYTYNGDGTVVISSYLGSASDVTTPKTISGKKVTKIGDEAFINNTALTSVTITDSVTSLGDNVFQGCTKLSSVSLPESIKEVGTGVFRNCTSLKSVALPDKITTAIEMFYGCTSLTFVKLPKGMTNIESDMFNGCMSLPSITLPGTVTGIEPDAFAGCISLKKFTVPNVTSIDARAFRNCIDLETVNCPNLYMIGERAFDNCISLTDFTAVTSEVIGAYAFNRCKKLKTIKIEAGLKTVSAYAFAEVPGPLTVIFHGTKDDWKKVAVKEHNEALVNAKITYNIPVTGIKFTKDNPEMVTVNHTVRLNVNVFPSDAADKTVLWSTPNPKIVSVDKNGNVKGLKEGYTSIMATTWDGMFYDYYSIEVLDLHLEWYDEEVKKDVWKSFWYEHNERQAVSGDPKNLIDEKFGTERGREIFDPGTNAWYWLDSVYGGAKAEGKEVWMPYIYQDEAKWTDEQKAAIAKESDPGMADCVYEAMKKKDGKWVRYDENGAMLKGWVTIEKELADLYPSQKGNRYYYDTRTGLMAKGWVTLGGKTYHFDETTGKCLTN